MNNILNRTVLILGLSAFIFTCQTPQEAILPIITAITLSAFLEYFDSKNFNIIAFFGYVIVSLLFPQFALFLPIAFYDLLLTKYQSVAFVALIPLAANLDNFTPAQGLVLTMITVIEIILKHRAIKALELNSKYIEQRDDFTELSIELQHKIKELTDRQDTEVSFATLNERNRIAREIHDNVGHLLSSSILQIGAIMAVTKEENTKSSLGVVKNTLDTGMNSIRNSVHNLHEDSVDLFAQLDGLVRDFTFCTAQLNYEMNSMPDVSIKYAIISIVKEALANVIKHSNATSVTVSIYEHPMLYQLIILDNGNKLNINPSNGMGLESIRQRVNLLDGIVNFNYSKGFKIFISFPKDKEKI